MAGLNRFARILAGATFVLIVAGGLVTSTGSGLSVPDWPLSYGTWNPPMVGGIRFEHSHRVLAGVTGLLTLAFVIAVFRREKRAWTRALAASAFALVVIQALLGGATVLHFLPLSISASHATLAQTFFALIAAFIVISSREWADCVRVTVENGRSVARLLVVTTAFIFIQLVSGSIVRHSHGRLLAFHIILALIIAMHAVFIVTKVLSSTPMSLRLRVHAKAWLAVIGLQLLLGGGAYWAALVLPRADVPSYVEVWLRTAHQANGALVLAGVTTLMLRFFRCFR